MLKAVIFDLDGTLCDTMEDIANAVNFSLVKHGYKPHSLKDFRLFLGSGSKYLIKKALGEENLKDFDIVFDDYVKRYAEYVSVCTKAYDGMNELLSYLRKSGLYVCVLTNKPQMLADKMLADVFPEFKFDLVVGQSDKILPKPDLTGFNCILNKFDLKNDEIIYIGDSDVDMITSKKANVGLQICCTYGFRTVEELKPLAPKYMVSCPLEAQKIIEKALKK